jgi:hypothetical protein
MGEIKQSTPSDGVAEEMALHRGTAEIVDAITMASTEAAWH